eukprot:c20634_g1_i1 orf=174-545(+)
MEQRKAALLLVLLCVGLLTQVRVSSSASAEERFMYNKFQGFPGDKGQAELGIGQEEEQMMRVQRLLVGVAPHISYGVLQADRVRCPPQSGRSYYDPDCRTATGPVNSYKRGCLTIARCGIDSS